jgi:hypothetical protein
MASYETTPVIFLIISYVPKTANRASALSGRTGTAGRPLLTYFVLVQCSRISPYAVRARRRPPLLRSPRPTFHFRIVRNESRDRLFHAARRTSAATSFMDRITPRRYSPQGFTPPTAVWRTLESCFRACAKPATWAGKPWADSEPEKTDWFLCERLKIPHERLLH